MNTSHLHALELRLHNTRRRASQDKRGDQRLWAGWIAQIENEITEERKFLGLPPLDAASDQSSPTDEELLAALMG